ncbi:MAG: carbohydrate-binding family 9-like protein [Anaerolineae bacterium]|nr:carbohydrate-binding family 9-like protein [Anaerolineae bacterium]
MARYTAYRTRQSITIDGRLNKPAWNQAPKSPRFIDVIGGTPALYDTRSAVVWDETNLYIAFWVEEPFVSAHQTERDSLIFLENDVEVFIDGGDTYYEFELNALGTIYEVFFIWQDAYQRGGRFDVPEFDIFSRKALTFGGNHDRSGQTFWWGAHPRRTRWAFLDWDFPGLQVGVQIDGRLNDPTEAGKGWTVELAFPWSGMKWLANGRSLPPKAGDEWRIFFGRYEELNVSGSDVYAGWSWDRVGTADNHLPECFTRIQFSDTFVEDL